MFKKKEIKVIDGVIPYNEIKDENEITFVIITKDEDVLSKSIEAIKNLHEKNKDKDFKVVISSSYEKLHKISNGAF